MTADFALWFLYAVMLLIAFDVGRYAGQRECRRRLREALLHEQNQSRKKNLEAAIMLPLRPLPHMFWRAYPLTIPPRY